MTSTLSRLPSRLTRRNALTGIGVTATAVGLDGRFAHASAQDTDLSSHPLTGTWMAMANPPLPDDLQFPAPSLFAADGAVLLIFPTSQIGPQGPFLNAPVMGTWESDSDRRGHFTAVQLMSSPGGTFLGSVTIDGFPEVSEDGATFIADGSRATITMRDAAGAIVNQIIPNGQPAGRPVTAVRMGVGTPGFPESSDATPTS
jgi:hypothetical protein